ncbi:MAG: glycosyltransferase [Microgenomates group bacterium]
MGKIFLSVVIPAYNEEENIKNGSLDTVNDFLIKEKFSWEVLIVDDASTYKTLELAEAFTKKHPGFRVLKEPHRGKGGTVIAGVLAAKGKVILFIDMDQATPINQIKKFIPKFDEGFDVVIGSRAGRRGAPVRRKIMAYGFALLRTVVLKLPYKDTQCGFKAFRQTAAKEIFKRMKVFNEKAKVEGAAVTAGFDLEVLYIARKLGLKVSEVPVTWYHKKTERINVIKDSWQGFRDLMQVRINALLGRYKIT